MTSPQASVELFHLLFLRHMSEKLEKSLYSIKGGSNLRFFFKSIRYSEDLDIDVKTIAKETLNNKINKLFADQQFRHSLAARGIEIDRLSEPKQTDTTQRWKLGIKLSHISMPLPTKIEFSRRAMDETFLFEPIDPELIQSYQLYPILANHYAKEAAFCQKVDALIHRTEVQARDIFDLQLLLNKGVHPRCLPMALKKKLGVAQENVLLVGFAEFKSQVVAYLMYEYQEYYSSSKIWNEIQTRVILALEEH